MSTNEQQITELEQRRQAVFKAAFRLFDQQGFQATSLPQIAQAAGIPLELVRLEFGVPINILLQRLIHGDCSVWQQGYRQLFELHDPVDAVYDFGRLTAQFFLEHLGLPLCRELMAQIQLGLHGDSRLLYEEILGRIQESLKQLLEHLLQRGLLPAPQDLDSIVQVLMDVGHSYCARLLRDGPLKVQTTGVNAREAIRLFFEGVRALQDASGPAAPDEF